VTPVMVVPDAGTGAPAHIAGVGARVSRSAPRRTGGSGITGPPPTTRRRPPTKGNGKAPASGKPTKRKPSRGKPTKHKSARRGP
jgi:hypothetical protein